MPADEVEKREELMAVSETSIGMKTVGAMWSCGQHE